MSSGHERGREICRQRARHNRRSALDVATGLGSLIGLLVLVCGVPTVLLAQGSATHAGRDLVMLGHPALVWRRFHHPLSDTALGGALVLLAWVVWGYLTLCLFLSAMDRIRGWRPIRLPGSARAQAVAAAVVGASLSLLVLGRGTPHVRLQPSPVIALHRPPVEASTNRSVGSGGAPVKLASSDRSSSAMSPVSGHTGRLPVTPIGIGILGAGVVMMLDRMRRAQQRRRRQGRVITLPQGHQADVERGLRAANDAVTTSELDLGIRLLGLVMEDAGATGPSVVAVRCEAQHLEFVLEPGHGLGPAPAPFEASTDPAVWVLPHLWSEDGDARMLRVLAGRESPCPALVTLGYDDRGRVLVNLQGLGSLSVGGADSAMVLQAMAVELATLPWAETVEVIVVGHPGQLRGLERVRQVTSAAAAVAEARRHAGTLDRLRAERDMRSSNAHRWTSDVAGASDAMVVICLPPAAEAEPAACQALAGAAGNGRQGVTVLIGTSCQGVCWSTVADGGPIAISGPEPLWSHAGPVRPQPVVPDLLAEVDGLMSLAASHDEGVDVSLPTAEPVVSGFALAVEPGTSSVPVVPTPTDHEIEVRILGPVDIVGNAKPFTRAWSLELVVFLALHPEGSSTDAWSAALWPDRLMAPASLHSTASAARRALGTSASGEDHLPRAHGRLVLGPSCTTDWERFRRLAAADNPEGRTEALRLIRGRPFDGLRSTDWALLEGTVATMEAVVVDVASRQAEWCLERGDPAGAETAARQGLRVSAYDERLYRVLIRGADAAGNPAGIESAMHELVRLVGEEIEPYDAVHPETLELYRRLSRRGAARRGA